MHAIETFECRGFTVKIYRDEDAESPGDWGDDAVFLITTTNRYFEVKRKGFTMDGCRDGEYTDYCVYPLYAYIHGGVALNLGREGQFGDQWDSGQIGYVLVKREELTNPPEAAQSLVEEWNQYLSGDVYGYVIEEDGEHIDSCWGFYGMDYALQEAREAAEEQAEIREEEDRMERDQYAV